MPKHTLSPLPLLTLPVPSFFPDGTRGAVRALDARDLEMCRVPGLVMNTYHMLTRPGAATVRALGGLHAFTGWKRPIITDSGGFQVFSLIRENPKYGEIRDKEIVFRPEGGREKLVLSPEKCIQAQFAFGSDILMCLDYCTHPEDPPEIQQKSVEITLRWAERCHEEYLRQVRARGKAMDASRPRLFGIIQGGDDPALRTRCAQGLKQIGFDGYGFGGWPLDGQGRLTGGILRHTADLMPDGAPKYAMGLGKPEEIVALFDMGYTIFDCVIPTREARHGRLYVLPEGFSPEDLSEKRFYSHHYIMDEAHYRDPRPVSQGCDCYLCQNHSRAYLRHLFKVNDSQAYRLASMHNVRFYTRLMEMLAARGRQA